MSKTYLQKTIDARLNPESAVPLKQIMLHLPEDTIVRLTQLATDLTAMCGNRITRNNMISDAIDVCLEEGELFVRRRKEYPVGTIVKLISSDDPRCPINPGTPGRVTEVGYDGTVQVFWKSCAVWGAAPGRDVIEKEAREAYAHE